MILDANTWLGKWPFADVEPDTTEELLAHQAALGIQMSSVAPMEAVFYQDPQPANDKLYRQVRHHPTLEPVAVLNPSMANWRDELEASVAGRLCRQVRLVPNYHQYALDDPRLDDLLEAAAALGAKVSVQVRVEDERAHHPLMKVPGVPVAELAALAERRRESTFLVLCCYRQEVLQLHRQPNLLFGLSHVEFLDTLNDLLTRVDPRQVVFASHTPLLETRAALAKLEQCTASAEVKDAIAGGNLAEWLGGARREVPWLG